RAETDSLEAEQAVDAAQQDVASAKASLAFLLGARDPAPSFEVDSDLPPTTPPAALDAETPETLLAQARESRPDLPEARAQGASAEAPPAPAQRQRIPGGAVIGGYQRLGHGQQALQPPTASIGFSTTLPILYRNEGEIAKAEAARLTLSLQRSKL